MRGFWDKVTLKWDFRTGRETSVHEEGHFEPNLYNPRVYSSEAHKKMHGLFGMEIYSLYEDSGSRIGEVRLDVRHKTRTVAPKKDAIKSLLVAEFERGFQNHTFRYAPVVIVPEGNSWSDTIFIVRFGLENGEQFCDIAIEVARATLAALGVYDREGRTTTDFELKRETFAKFEGNWITFENWLRMKHCLPVVDRSVA